MSKQKPTIGELRHPINIFKLKEKPDSGVGYDQYLDVIKQHVKAKVEAGRSSNYDKESDEIEILHYFTIRYDKRFDLSKADLVEYNKKFYKIKAIKEFDQYRTHMILTCVEDSTVEGLDVESAIGSVSPKEVSNNSNPLFI